MAEMTKEAVDYIERSCRKYRQATVGIEGEHTQCISDLEDLITSHRLLSNERDRLKRERDYFENKSACRGLEADLEEIDRLRAKLSQAQATIRALKEQLVWATHNLREFPPMRLKAGSNEYQQWLDRKAEAQRAIEGAGK